jgi:hypothetical protein
MTSSWTSGQQIIVDVGGEPELWWIISETVAGLLSLTPWLFDWEMKRLAEDGWPCLQATQRAALDFQNRMHVLIWEIWHLHLWLSTCHDKTWESFFIRGVFLSATLVSGAAVSPSADMVNDYWWWPPVKSRIPPKIQCEHPEIPREWELLTRLLSLIIDETLHQMMSSLFS